MQRKALFIWLLLTNAVLQGQGLHLYDINKHREITGDTILIQSVYNNGWVGYESLDIICIIENKSANAIEIGAKKMEFEQVPKSVLHTICFAGGCYDTGTYISPNHITLAPGNSDSSFIAHYLFDNRIHTRGLNHIAYVFYDVQHPNDSVVVYVNYNTIVKNAGIGAPSGVPHFLNPYPNPAKDFIFFKPRDNGDDLVIKINNMTGETILKSKINAGDETISFNISLLPPGVYSCAYFENNILLKTKKITIIR